MSTPRKYDVFVSYASEDKADIASPLASELRKRGLSVWFDDFELEVGSSLRESIERGLAASRFGIVIFSSAFFKKRWPTKELNGLFAKEISGRKPTILPIFHKITPSTVSRRLPIQADRVALNSDAPLSDICEKIIKVVRPSLLEAKNLRARSIEASESFILAAKKDYPGYDFGVLSNVVSTPGQPARTGLEIRVADPDALVEPPTISIQFVGEGARKAEEFLKTGKPQTWMTGEFTSVKSAIPFFSEMTEGEFSVTGPANAPTLYISLRCGDSVFPLMSLRLIRAGTDEAEFEISSDSEPVRLTLVWPLGGADTSDMRVSWSIAGFSAKRVQRAVRFVDAMQAGAEIEIVNLKSEPPSIALPMLKPTGLLNPFDQRFRNFVDLCALIEEQFKMTLKMSSKLTDDDLETLNILESLLNGTEVGVKISSKRLLIKGFSSVADQCMQAGLEIQGSLFLPVDNYKGYMPLFGSQIPAPLFGIASEFRFTPLPEEVAAFVATPVGEEYCFTITNDGRGRYRWASDFQELITD